MADHLDFIRIHGLEVSDAEMFQGVSGGDVSLSPDDGDTPMLDWGEIPEEAVSLLSQYTDDVNAWLTQMQSYDPNAETRDLPAVPPAVPALIAALAIGGAGLPALPAVATVMITQAVVNTMGSALQSLANRYDANSVEYILRKALLYNDGNTEASLLEKAWLRRDGGALVSLMEKAWLYQDGATFASILQKAWLYEDTDDPVIKSILKKALLYVENTDGKDLLESVLNRRLSDLAYVDEILDFGPFRIHIKGKMIEYA